MHRLPDLHQPDHRKHHDHLPITLADTTLTIGESTLVTFKLTTALASFSSIYIDPPNGTLGPMSRVDDGHTWTATFTPADNVQRVTGNTLQMVRSGIDDTPSAPFTIDTMRPTIDGPITIADNKLSAGESTTITITFSEALDQSSFTIGEDLSLVDSNGKLPTGASRGTLSNLRTTDGKVWTVTLTAPTTGNPTDTALKVSLGTLTDLAGNSGNRTIEEYVQRSLYVIDTERPLWTSARIYDAEGNTTDNSITLKPDETATIRIVFSEEVTGFKIDNLTLTNTDGGKLSGLTLDATDTSRKTWTATLTPPTTGIDSTGNALRVKLSGVEDLAGNAASWSDTLTDIRYRIDARPTLTSASISYAEGKTAGTPLKASETATVRFVFSEEVKDFGIDDITLSNATGGGRLSGLARDNSDTSRKTWTATLTAPTTGTGSTDNTLSVNLAGINDLAGNAGTGTATTAIRYGVDTTPPTLGGIAINNTRLAAGQSTAVTITFSEAVSNVAAAVHADNGALGPFTGSTDGKTWSATLTPSAGVEAASNHITVDMARITDSAGNTGSGEQSSDNYVVDTRAPVLAGAAVDGNQLVLSYTEANSLDAAALAGNGGFTVTNGGGTAIDVTNVSVDPAGKAITLTLSPSVTSQDTVTVSYTQPASGNVVQDATGNDAANFTGQAVTNNTPVPPIPVPVDPVAPDTDRDHVPNAEENQAIGPNGELGDGNGDGIQDSTQAAVGSISVTTSSGTSSSVALVAGSQDGKVSPDSNVSITRLEQKETPADLPRGLEMPIGLVQFQTTPASAGSSEKSSLYVAPALGSNGYWVQDHSGTWVNLASEPYGGKMVDEGGRLRLDFQITDGGQFDADGKVDGVITAPGAVAHMPLSIVGQAPDTEHGGFWF